MAGRKPTPTATLRLRGTYRNDRHGERLELPASVPNCPSFLGAEGKREWRRIVNSLKDVQLLTESDRAALALYCQAWDEFIGFDKVVKNGELVQQLQSGNHRINPAVQARANAAMRVLKTCAELGFTPASRGRVVSTAKKKEKQNGKDRFFKSG